MKSLFRKIYWNTFTVWHARHEGRLPFRPLDEIVAIQNRRVRAIVAHAYDTVPYYRQVMDDAGLRPGDFQTADDLARLPILTGEQLAREPERFLSRHYASGGALRLSSAGTTGLCKRIYHDPASLFLALAHGHRQRVVLAHFVGRTFGYREVTAERPNSISTQLRRFYESTSWVPHRIDFERAFASPVDSFEDNIIQINAFRPDVIRGYGSYIGALFRHAWQRGLPVFRPKVVLYGADGMADKDRELIETEFHVPVLSSYQASEALHIAFQCERQRGFHISLDQVAIRVVDQDGVTLGPGNTGEIVISNLVNRATVLLNYKLGDWVTLGELPCSCGRSLPTIERIEGRADDLIVQPGGQRLLPLTVIGPLLSAPGVIQVQLVQHDLRQFLLRVVCVDDTCLEQSRQELDAIVRSVLGEDIAVTIEQVDAIPPEASGKVRAAISQCAR
jgi:phenylacetate-CoA ligase